MRKTAWLWFACVLLLLLAVACDPKQQEGTPNPGTAAPETSPVTHTPASEPTPAPTIELRPTNTRVIRPTATIEPFRSLAPGWQQLGDERFGLQAAVPDGWVDVTRQLRMSAFIDRFGPQMMLLADNSETANKLLSGEPFEQGALVFGFAPAPSSAGATHQEALIDLLTSTETEGLLPITVETTRIGGLPAVYVDLAFDPFNLFAAYPESLHFRVIMIEDPEAGNPAVFVIASSADEWIIQGETFTSISESVRLPQTSINIFGHMNSGDFVQGTLEEALDNLWTFAAEEGDYATISLSPEGENVDLTLTLLDPAGNVLSTSDDGYAGDLEIIGDIALPEDGTYFIQTSEFFNEPGRYRLSLLVSEEPEIESGGIIEFEQEVTAQLAPDNEDLWYFEGIAGQVATVILSSLDESFDVILELISPDDRTIVVLNEGFVGDAEVLAGYELPLTGRYELVVRGFDGRGGMYSLTLDEGGDSTANFFDVGDLVYGDIRQESLRKDEAHAWFFNGAADTEITIEVAPLEPAMDLDIWLLDPDLQELVMVDEHLLGEAERIDYKIPATGQYLILVREFFGEPGGYEISLSTEGVDELEIAGRIVYSDTVRGFLEPISRDAWLLAGEVDDVIDIMLTPITEERDLVLLLIDPSGNTAIKVDATPANSPERLVAFRLTSTGEWKIVVKEFFNEGSDYKMLLTRRQLEDQRP